MDNGSTVSAIRKTALAIVSCAEARSNKDKAWAIHRWLIENIHYADEELENNEIVSDPQKVFKLQRASCSGFANLFRDMARAVDIKTRGVEGKSMHPFKKGRKLKPWQEHWCEFNKDQSELWCAHKWNEITLEDGNVFSVDTTWSDIKVLPHFCQTNEKGKCIVFDKKCEKRYANGFCAILSDVVAPESPAQAAERRRTRGPNYKELKFLNRYFGPAGPNPWKDHVKD